VGIHYSVVVLNYWIVYAATFLTITYFSGFLLVAVGPLFFNIISDSWSISFFFLLFIVSSRVLRWSYYYMDGEEYYIRFVLIVISFVFSIVILIFIGSLLGALIGWDGLGVTSFLLVVYYKNRKSLGSGIITALTNRLGDCFFLLILGLFFYSYSYFYFLVFLLLIASITKRAQVPFSSWLPSAMAAPTPVRALVHSSTLVTAGVYLLLRFNLFTMEWMLLLGRLTILIAGVRACTELDIKKIVALSTLSQLGVIIVSLSLYQKNICFFHLVTHAIFKALLFICVGISIHTIYGSQDFRSFRNLGKGVFYPIRFLTISNIALLGFPFISGFYRKDMIIERFYSSYSCYWGGIFFLLGIGITTAYSIKITNLACLNNRRILPISIRYGGLRWQIKFPLSLLGLCSILRGIIISCNLRFSVILGILDKVIPLIIILVGVMFGFILSNYKDKNFSSILILRPVFQKTRVFSKKGEVVKIGDSGFIEDFGGPGLLSFLKNFFFSFHPLISVSLVLLFLGYF